MNKYLLLVTIAFIASLSACKKEVTGNKSIIDTIKINDTIKVNVNELDRPINLKASKGLYGNRIIVTWTPIPKAKNYRLFKFDDTKQDYQLLKESADTSYTDLATVTPLTKVFYKVMVYNSNIEYSKFSDIDYGYTTGQAYSRNLFFGSPGSGQGQFVYPNYVEVDKDDNIYVADLENGKVQKFDKTGKFLELFFAGIRSARGLAFLKNGNAVVTQLTLSDNYVKIIDKQKNVVASWGSFGTGNGKFQNIEGITVDDDQNIYIVDGINNVVQKFDQTGKFLLKFTATIQAPNQAHGPYPFGICYYNNKIFVTSPYNSIIRIYDKNGKFLNSLDAGTTTEGIKARNNYLYIACAGFILKTDEKGEIREKIGVGQFSSLISGLTVNSEDEIIVTEVYEQKIISYKHL